MKHRRSAVFAVAAGFFADLLTTQALVVFLGGALAAKTIHLDLEKAPPGQLESLLNQMMQTLPFLTCATALGLVASMVGGYVAATFSPSGTELRSAFFSGALSLCVGATAFLDPGAAPRWLLIAGFALQLPATLGGALLQSGARRDESGAASRENHDDT